jgi:hypothetical protein
MVLKIIQGKCLPLMHGVKKCRIFPSKERKTTQMIPAGVDAKPFGFAQEQV